MCLHQLMEVASLMVSRQIGHIRSSEASSGAAWGTWLVLAAGERVPSSAKSSSNAISHCKQKRYKAHDLPWRRNLQEAAKLWKLSTKELPALPRGCACAATNTRDHNRAESGTRGVFTCSCSQGRVVTDRSDTCRQELGRQESSSWPLSNSSLSLEARQVRTSACQCPCLADPLWALRREPAG